MRNVAGMKGGLRRWWVRGESESRQTVEMLNRKEWVQEDHAEGKGQGLQPSRTVKSHLTRFVESKISVKLLSLSFLICIRES